MVDTDPQASIGNWYQADKAKFDLAEAASEKDIYGVKKSLGAYDYVIIDGAAAISAISAAAVMVSDAVLIPVSPSPLDFAASGAIISITEARQALSPLPVRFLITKKIQNAKMLEVLRDSIKDTGIAVLKTATAQRQSYIKTMLDGTTIFETPDSQAKAEIELITKEIMELVRV